ncbi:uncharacterized protein [Spinacia oleracea]|uniref:Uncharacterized protein n=1 Tax=Spinacia oleracea TaxID=3562 RepID=A0ABM3R474_SPIOL|nr:uncharacterized protein LOC130465607 [Spinacia oleracea]
MKVYVIVLIVVGFLVGALLLQFMLSRCSKKQPNGSTLQRPVVMSRQSRGVKDGDMFIFAGAAAGGSTAVLASIDYGGSGDGGGDGGGDAGGDGGGGCGGD